VANWKMYKTVKEAIEFLNAFIPLVKDINAKDIAIAPSFVCIDAVGRNIKNTKIKLCAQNAFYENQGAYTGEISPLMLKALDVEYVIIGHSERRRYFNETDEIINKKIKACLKENLKVIFCIGETLSERENNETEKILNSQLENGLKEIEIPESIVVAYEPVWAIGTGKVASDEQIKEAHLFVRKKLEEIFGEKAQTIRILYGGSVSPENIDSIMAIENVDGVLVGGASLDPLKFSKIINHKQN